MKGKSGVKKRRREINVKIENKEREFLGN